MTIEIGEKIAVPDKPQFEKVMFGKEWPLSERSYFLPI